MCLLTELWPAPSCFFTFKWSLEDLYVPASMLSFREVFQKAHVDMILHKINNISVWWMQLYCKRKGNSFLSRVNRSTGSPESTKSALHHDSMNNSSRIERKDVVVFFSDQLGLRETWHRVANLTTKRLKLLGGVVLGLGVFIDNNASFFVNKSPRKSIV